MNKKSLFLVDGDPPRKKPKQGSLPKLNIPKKTTANESTAPQTCTRTSSCRCYRPKKHYYESLQQLKNSVHNLKSLRNWTLTVAYSHLILENFEVPWEVAKIKITIDDNLGYTVKSFDWLLPEDHCIYKEKIHAKRFFV